MKLTSPRKAALLHGLLWAVAHAALIYFSFKYGPNYWGGPWSGIPFEETQPRNTLK